MPTTASSPTTRRPAMSDAHPDARLRGWGARGAHVTLRMASEPPNRVGKRESEAQVGVGGAHVSKVPKKKRYILFFADRSAPTHAPPPGCASDRCAPQGSTCASEPQKGGIDGVILSTSTRLDTRRRRTQDRAGWSRPGRSVLSVAATSSTAARPPSAASFRSSNPSWHAQGAGR